MKKCYVCKRLFFLLTLLLMVPIPGQSKVYKNSFKEKNASEKNVYATFVEIQKHDTPFGEMTAKIPMKGKVPLASIQQEPVALTKEQAMGTVISGAYAEGKWYGYVVMEFFGNTIPAYFATYDINDSAREKHVGPYNDNPYLFSDMSYDYSGAMMYAIGHDVKGEANNRGTSLFSVDIKKQGVYEKIGNFDRNFVALACNFDGYLFGVDANGTLHLINKEKLTLTPIGPTGVVPDKNAWQSMDFDHETGKLYWAAKTADSSYMMELNTISGAGTILGRIALNRNIVAMYVSSVIVADSAAPSQVLNFSFKPDLDEVSLRWKNPEKNCKGANLANLSKIEILRNGEIVHTINNPVVGAELEWVHRSLPEGLAYYQVVAYNSFGRGIPVGRRIVIGKDYPAAVSDLLLTKEGKNGKLTWKKPSEGLNQGVIDESSLAYVITRLPDKKQWTNIKGESFLDETIGELSNYQYEVLSITAQGEGGSALSNKVMLGSSFTPPYYCSFIKEIDFLKWTIINENKDAQAWEMGVYAEYPFAFLNTLSETAKDWLVGPPVSLKKGKTYRARYVVTSGSDSYTAILSAVVLQGYTVSDLKKTIKEATPYKGQKLSYESIDFTVEEDGDYNLGFLCTTNSSGMGTYVSGIALEEVFDVDLRAYEVKGRNFPTEGKTYTYRASVVNNGTAPVSDYKIVLKNENKLVFAEQTISESLAAGAVKTVEITAEMKNGGSEKMYVCVEKEGDKNLSNDTSRPFDVLVQWSGSEYMELQHTAKSNNAIPLSMMHPASASQVIYYPEEIGITGGVIKDMVLYQCNGNGQETDRSMRIMIANTSLSSLENGWIPESEFVEVFNGSVNFKELINHITIDLDRKFIYTGGNLCVLVITPFESVFRGSFQTFYCETDTLHTKRSLAWGGYEGDFNFGQKGVISNAVPFIQLGFTTSGGYVLNGKVTAQSESGKGLVSEIRFTTKKFSIKTNEKGEYEVPYLPDGSYPVVVSSLGYTTIFDTITITKDTVHNMVLEPRATYKIKGKVVDAENMAVKNAQVRVSGYARFETKTNNSDGSFEIPSVFEDNTYYVEIFSEVSETYKTEVFAVSADKDLGIIKLKDVLFAPRNVMVVKENTAAKLSWEAPAGISTFRYDDGRPFLALGGDGGSKNTILGSTHRTPAVLHSMSWRTIPIQGVYHPLVNVFVLDLNADGEPTSTVLYSKEGVPNQDTVWSSHAFPSPVNAPNGFMIAISYSGGNVGLSNDNSPESTVWPFREKSNYFASDYTNGKFQSVEDAGFPRNLMIRAEGVIKGLPLKAQSRKLSRSLISEKTKNSSAKCVLTEYVFETKKDAAEEAETMSAVKSEKGYKVWRFLTKDIENTGKWQLLTPSPIQTLTYTDAKFSEVPIGFYQYAVRTIYTNNHESDPVISNTIDKNAYTQINVSAKTNTSQNEIGGALLKIVNKDDPKYTYSTKLSSSGEAAINKIVKGVYSLSIELAGFKTWQEATLDISMKDVYEFSYTLEEIIKAPYNLEIADGSDFSSKVFSWNNLVSMEEDFSSHKDFTINSPGDIAWQYIDGDQSETYGINGVSWPNVEKAMAYIVINPSKTEPAITESVEPHSGEKFLASFASISKRNDDYIISPLLTFKKDFVFSFYAQAFSEEYKEEFQVGYSTTTATANAFTWLTKGNVSAPAKKWTLFSYPVPKEAKYVCIRYVSDDAFAFFVDDIFIGYPDATTASDSKSFSTYEVYLDGNKVANVKAENYTFTGLSSGKHTAGVKSVYTSQPSALVSIDFVVTSAEENLKDLPIVLFPNPAKNRVEIQGEYTSLEIYDIQGTLVYKSHTKRNQLNLSDFKAGLYTMKFFTGKDCQVQKLVIQ